ncbi:hypothetical protein [Psychroserpens ponticola]|uniref:Uncharacterized protein n=1 Tax=Psychroserpens ponticola TaxID=2932268 RepID=A0ABY7S5C3_9FLAO|nr:hypothetical protein [Psychroserpens ponticola]WCO03616.1 hypothetical protein MUN68_008915 [Psychroserpens ponticola]
MKRITFIILFCLITMNLQGQCDSISKEVLNIIKTEKYERFENLIMPIEQQRKIMHWPKSEEADKMLLTIKDSLKKELTLSVKQLRLELLGKGFDLNKTEFNNCQLVENKLNVFITNNENKSSFTVETLKTDKRYLMLPINQLAPKLPDFQPTKEELENSTIIISGEKFKPFKPSQKEKEKGLEILKKCVDTKKTASKNILFANGMKDKNGITILTFMTVSKSDMNRYKVILEKETCEKE